MEDREENEPPVAGQEEDPYDYSDYYDELGETEDIGELRVGNPVNQRTSEPRRKPGHFLVFLSNLKTEGPTLLLRSNAELPSNRLTCCHSF